MKSSPYDRDEHGVQVRSTMIYERTLELSSKLCWNSEDLGISRVHFHSGQTFKSRSALENFCRERGETPPEPKYLFDWLDPIKKYAGVARENYLRNEHWSNREQVVNILLDIAMQAYLKETQQLLCSITGENFKNAEFVKFSIKNLARQYTGAPDSTFIDLQSGNIALVEIKIGDSSTKYSLDQFVKYETLSALLRSEKFFPGFQVHKILLGPSDKFSENTFMPKLLGPSSDSEGRVSFKCDPTALAELKPEGFQEISSLVTARVANLSKNGISAAKKDSNDGIWFFSWPAVEHLAPSGLLRDNITALMRHLSPRAGEQIARA